MGRASSIGAEPAVEQQQPSATAAAQQAAVRRRLAALASAADGFSGKLQRVGRLQRTAHGSTIGAMWRPWRRRLRQHRHHESFGHDAALHAAEDRHVGDESTRNGSGGRSGTGHEDLAEEFPEDLTGLSAGTATAHSVSIHGDGGGSAADEAADAEAAALVTAQLQAAVQQSLDGRLGGRAGSGAGSQAGDLHGSGGGSTGNGTGNGSRTGGGSGSGEKLGVLLMGDSIDRDTLIDARDHSAAVAHCLMTLLWLTFLAFDILHRHSVSVCASATASAHRRQRNLCAMQL